DSAAGSTPNRLCSRWSEDCYRLPGRKSMAANSEQRLNELKQKYQSVLNMIQQQNVRLEDLHIQDNKLFLSGTAPSENAKNRVWDQIKLVDATYSDLMAEFRVDQQEQTQTAGAAVGGSEEQSRIYTVRPGDTLSKISQQFYGS